jgi:hypothetical protein
MIFIYVSLVSVWFLWLLGPFRWFPLSLSSCGLSGGGISSIGVGFLFQEQLWFPLDL